MKNKRFTKLLYQSFIFLGFVFLFLIINSESVLAADFEVNVGETEWKINSAGIFKEDVKILCSDIQIGSIPIEDGFLVKDSSDARLFLITEDNIYASNQDSFTSLIYPSGISDSFILKKSNDDILLYVDNGGLHYQEGMCSNLDIVPEDLPDPGLLSDRKSGHSEIINWNNQVCINYGIGYLDGTGGSYLACYDEYEWNNLKSYPNANYYLDIVSFDYNGNDTEDLCYMDKYWGELKCYDESGHISVYNFSPNTFAQYSVGVSSVSLSGESGEEPPEGMYFSHNEEVYSCINGNCSDQDTFDLNNSLILATGDSALCSVDEYGEEVMCASNDFYLGMGMDLGPLPNNELLASGPDTGSNVAIIWDNRLCVGTSLGNVYCTCQLTEENELFIQFAPWDWDDEYDGRFWPGVSSGQIRSLIDWNGNLCIGDNQSQIKCLINDVWELIDSEFDSNPTPVNLTAMSDGRLCALFDNLSSVPGNGDLSVKCYQISY